MLKPSSGTCGIVACGDSGLAGATILQVQREQVFYTGYVWLLPADRIGVMKIVGHCSVSLFASVTSGELWLSGEGEI